MEKIGWIVLLILFLSTYIYARKYYVDIKYARRQLGISTRSNWQIRNAPKEFKTTFFITYLKAYFHISLLMGIVSIIYINSFTIFGNEIITFFLPLFILCSEIINNNRIKIDEQEEYNKYDLIQNLFDIINLIKDPIINIFKSYSPQYFCNQELKCIVVKLKDSNYQCYEKYYNNKQDIHLGQYILRIKDIILRNVGEDLLGKDDLSEMYNLDNKEQMLELEYITGLKNSLENLIRYYVDSLKDDNNNPAIQIYYELNTFLNHPSKYANLKSFISLAVIQNELNQSSIPHHENIDEINTQIKKFYDDNYSIKQVQEFINDEEMSKQFEEAYTANHNKFKIE